MYGACRNQAAAAYSPLYFFSFLSLQFSNIKFSSHLKFLRNFEAYIVETLYTRGGSIMYTRFRLLEKGGYTGFALSFHDSVTLDSVTLSGEKFRRILPRNCESYKVEIWWTRGPWVAVSCIPESGRCYFFVPSFLHFLSSNFKH